MYVILKSLLGIVIVLELLNIGVYLIEKYRDKQFKKKLNRRKSGFQILYNKTTGKYLILRDN